MFPKEASKSEATKYDYTLCKYELTLLLSDLLLINTTLHWKKLCQISMVLWNCEIFCVETSLILLSLS